MSNTAEPLLITLSEACEHHRASHECNDEHDDEVMPERCKKDLKTLQALLPKLEETLRVDVKGVTAEAVQHLCDFYLNALEGIFCPYSRTLFQTGNTEHDVFSRVISLMNHLHSKRVVHAAGKSPQVMEKITTTIARFLAIDTKIHASVARDLVKLSFDLSIVRQANLLMAPEPVAIAIFTETIGALDYTLEIKNIETLTALQGAAFNLVLEYMKRLRDTRIDSLFEPLNPQMNTDLVWQQMLRDVNHCRMLLASIRQVILSPPPQQILIRIFSVRSRICALELLSILIEEWSGLEHVMGTLVVEVSLILCGAIQQRLEQCKAKGEVGPSYESEQMESKLLTKMVKDVFLRPLRTSCPSIEQRIGTAALPILLDCIGAMTPSICDNEEKDLCLVTVQVVHVILQRCHGKTDEAMLLETVNNHCSAYGIYHAIFALQAESEYLTDTALSILMTLIGARGRENGQRVLAQAFQFAWCAIEANEVCTNEILSQKSPTTVKSPRSSAGGKRKRTTATKGKSPKKLQFERSPKRSSAKHRPMHYPETNFATNDAPKPPEEHQPNEMSASILDALQVSVTKALRITTWVSENSSCPERIANHIHLCHLARFARIFVSFLPKEDDNELNGEFVGNAKASRVINVVFESLGMAMAGVGQSWQRLSSSERIPASVVSNTESLVNLVLSCRLVLNCPLNQAQKKQMLTVHTFAFSREAELFFRSVATSLSLGVPLEQGGTTAIPIYPPSSYLTQMVANLNTGGQDTNLFTWTPASEGSEVAAVLKMPFVVKLTLAWFTSTFLERSVDARTKSELASFMPSMQRTMDVFESISRNLQEKGITSSFGYVYSALLPMAIRILDNEVSELLPDEPLNGISRSEAQHVILSKLCLAFPYTRLLSTWKQQDLSGELRNGCLVGIHHFLCVLRVRSLRNSLKSLLQEYCQRSNPFYASRLRERPLESLVNVESTIRLTILSSTVQGEFGTDAFGLQKWGIMKELIGWASREELNKLPRLSAPEGDFPSIPFCIHEMFSAIFSIKELKTRLLLSQQIGQLLFERNCHLLVSLFGEEEGSGHASVVSSLFRQLDPLLYLHGRVPQSQLSSTMTSDPGDSPDDIAPECQLSAMRTIGDLCLAAPLCNEIGVVIFQHTLLRMIRCWASADQPSGSAVLRNSVSLGALAFSEIRRVLWSPAFSFVLSPLSKRNLVPVIFSEILHPAADSLVMGSGKGSLGRDLRQKQCYILYSLVEFLVMTIENDDSVAKLSSPEDTPLRALNGPVSIWDMEHFFEDTLRSTLPFVIMEKDYDTLRLVVGFKRFFLAKHKYNRTIDSDKDQFIGIAIKGVATNKVLGSAMKSSISLEEQTKVLCLQPQMIESILPRLLVCNTDPSQLVFFLDVVLQKKLSLKTMICSSEQKILKGIFVELGISGAVVKRATQSLQMAAIARGNDSSEGARSKVKVPSAQSVALEWVSKHFMYLLVNIVQQKWHEKTVDQRINSFRSLGFMLRFLLPASAPQYVTQMIATASMAMSHEITQSMDRLKVWNLRSLCVRNLATYFDILVEGGVDNLEGVGQNLATIVASLFPVLVAEELPSNEEPEEAKIRTNAGHEAARILETFTTGDVGRRLSPYFKEVPFLPSNSLLDQVRENLAALMIDYDSLFSLTASQCSSQAPLTGRDISTAEGSVLGQDLDQRILPKLQQRLRVIRPLLSHASVSVRLVTLRHLIDLLSANRSLLYKLIEKEDPSSSVVTLNVYYVEGDKDDSRGSVTSLMEALLSRATLETNQRVRLLLASCFGEIGAVDPHRLGEMLTSRYKMNRMSQSQAGNVWQLTRPPWKVRIEDYEMYLLTRSAVSSLKAAPNSSEQHKIAHAIQNLLVLLDACAPETQKDEISVQVNLRTLNASTEPSPKGPMSKWLSDKLKEKGVHEVLEPYWLSSFSEKESNSRQQKPPSFFEASESYFGWISRWCRYMILRAKEDNRSDWVKFLYSCRLAIRSSAALSMTEFILPIVVLERLCFGTMDDEKYILNELLDAFKWTAKSGCSPTRTMPFIEKQMSVNTAFQLLDTLKAWRDREIESIYRDKEKVRDPMKAASHKHSVSGWPSSTSIDRISDLVEGVSLPLMAKSAEAMGMYGRSLLCLECHARSNLVQDVYDVKRNSGNAGLVSTRHGLGKRLCEGTDTGLLKDVLGHLEDYATLGAVPSAHEQLFYDRNKIREKEFRGDWAGALNDYERAFQAGADTAVNIATGSLGCLLELGMYENILNQVDGLLHRAEVGEMAGLTDVAKIIPYGIDAAWRLGRWSSLDDLVANIDVDFKTDGSESDFRLGVGKAMLNLQHGSECQVLNDLEEAKATLMTRLSVSAGDSYERAYPTLVHLHCIKEIEDACPSLCNKASNDECTHLAGEANARWSWDTRLDMASRAGSSSLLDVRLAMARLSKEPQLESRLYYLKGKKARKLGLLDVANTCFALSQSIDSRLEPGKKDAVGSIKLLGDIRMQLGKLEYERSRGGAALRILEAVNLPIHTWNSMSDNELKQEVATMLGQTATSHPKVHNNELFLDFSKRLLKATKWTAEGGLASVAEVMGRYRVANRLHPKWEKAHFEFGKYVDSILEARIVGLAQHKGLNPDDDLARQYALTEDMNCQTYLILTIQEYMETLKVGNRFVYQTLPRLLSLFFEFTSLESPISHRNKAMKTKSETPAKRAQDPASYLSNKKDETISTIEKGVRFISAAVLYTALPQLVSRISHPNSDTAALVQAALSRVLSRYPSQTMWLLAWVRNSLDRKRARIGKQIFDSAGKNLLTFATKERQPEKQERLRMSQKVLGASESLVSYLIGISKFMPKAEDRARTFTLKKWRGEVDLSEIIPPVQAALESPVDILRGARDPFPRFRAVYAKVQIMTSKAKPKRVKFFVIPGGPRNPRSAIESGSDLQRRPGDIGELHFLVKNEAKGDLRKDARVQDLNNVVNRLLVGASKGKRQRRLQLRTFAVTCLSEDCGIVEWVPSTESFRNLTAKSYNPQAPTYAIKRRGRRVTNFAEPTLKKAYEQCQELFFKQGDLGSAVRSFETEFLNAYPPLFYWWFVQNFVDPHSWYEARTNFTVSAAAWSAVGHAVVGLGDRHAENLLIDTSSGGCVHVDFDCIFDKGLQLPKPEIIPFRLTPNMIDGFGPVGADGLFTESLRSAMTILRDNRDTLVSVLEPFAKDPVIDWKRNKKASQGGESYETFRDTKSAQRSIKIIDERLRGIYNLRNPNLKNVRRGGNSSSDHDEDTSRMIPLSVDGQVHKMISEASSHENLVQIYVGWMPWV